MASLSPLSLAADGRGYQTFLGCLNWLLLLLHDGGVLKELLEEGDHAAGLVQGRVQVLEVLVRLTLHCLTALLSAKLGEKFLILDLHLIDLCKEGFSLGPHVCHHSWVCGLNSRHLRGCLKLLSHKI